MKIQYLDLHAQYLSIKDEIDNAIKLVISKSAFSGGHFVEIFENKFAEYCGVKYAAGVSSGTSALWIALKALGVENDDEVITVPNTFIATAEAISWCGATPVFVDVDPYSCTMNPAEVESRITERTKAIVPVHLYGQMAEMEPILSIARKYGLKVVEDAAQAHGAERNGVRAGGYGDAACFSFYPGKNLGAFGEAGAVVTNDREVYEKVCMIRDHGQKSRYYHVCKGSNERMDGIQGAVLSVKLNYLDEWNEKRRGVANLYSRELADDPNIKLPYEMEGNKHVYHIYQIQLSNRDLIKDKMNNSGVVCGIHYPVPIHKQDAYKVDRCADGRFFVTEEIARNTLSLPVYPEMSLTDVCFVIDNIKKMVL